jgi:hypothetical protein
MSQSAEIYKPLEDTFVDVIGAVKTTKETSKRVARQVKNEAGHLSLLLKGQVRTFVNTV